MRARLKNVVALIGIGVCIPLFLMLMLTKSDGQYEALLEKRFAELHERLRFAESLTKQRESDIHILRSQFTYLLQSVLHNNNTNRYNITQSTKASTRTTVTTTILATMHPGFTGLVPNRSVIAERFPNDLQSALVNFTDLYGQSSIHLPSLFTYLPHLSRNPNGMKPAYKLSRNRFGVSMVFGIPTIKREKVSYLIRTLQSLIDGLNEEEREDCLLIVFVAEPWNLKYVESLGEQIYKEFKTSVDSGLVEVISAPAEFYPNLDHLKETLGDSQQRVRWRTKQNLDFSFLMLYAKSKGVYYVQLEDDVISKPGYLSIMKTFTQQQKYSEWLVLEFSTLGFIGKLFKSNEIPILVEFFLMFHTDKPIDWLLDHYLTVKVCNPEKDNKHCFRMKDEVRRRYKPSLFQHIGMQSSLKGKVQKLKDKYFGKQGLYRAHVNPKAHVSTTLKTYQQYSLLKAYLGETFFWGISPRPNDIIKFEFTPPVVLEKFLFRSGNLEHPGDKLTETTVEIFPSSHKHLVKLGSSNAPYPTAGLGYYKVSRFNAEGVAEGQIKEIIGPIKVLRLHCQAKSDSWAILSEIYIKAKTE